MKEDGPDGGHVNMDILSRSVRHRLRDLMDDVSDCPAVQPNWRVHMPWDMRDL